MAFRDFHSELEKFALSNVAAVDTCDTLTKHLSGLSTEQLEQLAASLHLIPPASAADDDGESRSYTSDFLIDLLVRWRDPALVFYWAVGHPV